MPRKTTREGAHKPADKLQPKLLANSGDAPLNSAETLVTYSLEGDTNWPTESGKFQVDQVYN